MAKRKTTIKKIGDRKDKTQKIKVAELFAGVGGFRIGLEGWHGTSATSNYKEKYQSNYQVVWSNQWEPSTKLQHASDIYERRFGEENHSNDDISTVKVKDIPDHDLLVGGFPCQDYSVARQLSQAHGLKGKKGVLWWQIHRILKEKKSKKPKYLFLENVDRLLKSPAGQRGRDFAIMLSSLNALGYAVEWRVINAADYGMPQRRRRVFFIAYHKTTTAYKKIKSERKDWLISDGVFARSFEIQYSPDIMISPFKIEKDLISLTESFNKGNKSANPFGNTGLMINGEVLTFSSKPNYDDRLTNLEDILQDVSEIPAEFFLDPKDKKQWEYLKGSKKEPRKKSNGEIFYYTEGPLPFPDHLNRSSRTIITSEGGKTPSRFKHVVKQNGKLRRLTPIELERLNMFPDDHTKEANDTKRAFFMGNALVVGVIEKVGLILNELIAAKKKKKENLEALVA
ncbi:MAG TPA: DNA (cytosine-5-)-methyltransferase [Chitinophagaceae bacterium]|nr:DNA (cytosine-5-)-methyltransferase [Chitinophagaceae bacterium]